MNTASTGPTGQLSDTEWRAAHEFVGKLHERFDGQVVSVVVYGSRARGEADPDSDMDLLVVMSDTTSEIRRAVRYLAAEVWLEHGIYLSTRVWSVAHWRQLERAQTLLYHNIRADGITL